MCIYEDYKSYKNLRLFRDRDTDRDTGGSSKIANFQHHCTTTCQRETETLRQRQRDRDIETNIEKQRQKRKKNDWGKKEKKEK